MLKHRMTTPQAFCYIATLFRQGIPDGGICREIRTVYELGEISLETHDQMREFLDKNLRLLGVRNGDFLLPTRITHQPSLFDPEFDLVRAELCEKVAQQIEECDPEALIII